MSDGPRDSTIRRFRLIASRSRRGRGAKVWFRGAGFRRERPGGAAINGCLATF